MIAKKLPQFLLLIFCNIIAQDWLFAGSAVAVERQEPSLRIKKFGNIVFTGNKKSGTLDRLFACIAPSDTRLSEELWKALPRPPTGSPEVVVSLVGLNWLHVLFYDTTVNCLHWVVANIDVSFLKYAGKVTIPPGARANAGKGARVSLRSIAARKFSTINRGAKLPDQVRVRLPRGLIVSTRTFVEGSNYLGTIGYLPPCPPRSHKMVHDYHVVVIGTQFPLTKQQLKKLFSIPGRSLTPDRFREVVSGFATKVGGNWAVDEIVARFSSAQFKPGK